MAGRKEFPLSAAAKTLGPYSAHPSVAMVQKWAKELTEKTGRSLEEWIALTRKSGPPSEKERRDWLKKEHKLATNSAIWIAERAIGNGTGVFDTPESYLKTATEWVGAQYSGPRAALRPLYEQLLKLGFSLGKDVKACPCKTMVPLYRNHVFAQIKPSTNTRIDLGFALGKRENTKTADRYRRLRKERPHHAADRGQVKGGYRRRSEAVVEKGVRDGQIARWCPHRLPPKRGKRILRWS